MIDYSKPTAQMLGRWQPFHDGHLALFKEILKKTGQVVIMVRDKLLQKIIHLYLMKLNNELRKSLKITQVNLKL